MSDQLRVAKIAGDRVIVRRLPWVVWGGAVIGAVVSTLIFGSVLLVTFGEPFGLLALPLIPVAWLVLAMRLLRPLIVILDDSAEEPTPTSAEVFRARDVARLDVLERHESGRKGKNLVRVNAIFADGRERLLYGNRLGRVVEAGAIAAALSARWGAPIGEAAVLTLGETRVRIGAEEIVVRRGLGQLVGALATAACCALLGGMFLAFSAGPPNQVHAPWILFIAVTGLFLGAGASLIRFARWLGPAFIVRRAPALGGRSAAREVLTVDVAAVELRRAARVSDYDGGARNLQIVLHFRDGRPPIAICERPAERAARAVAVKLATDVRRWIGAPAKGRLLSFAGRGNKPTIRDV